MNDAEAVTRGEDTAVDVSGPVHDSEVRHPGGGMLPALQSLLLIIVVAVFVITFCFQPFRIPSSSMEPTLLVGDFLLVNKQDVSAGEASLVLPEVKIRRGDVVVFHDPVDATLHLVKRVVGVPGDRIRLRSGHVYINGRALDEPYAVYRPSGSDSFRDDFPRLQSADPDIDSRWWIRMRTLVDHGELIIPAGDYFVLGDNRNDSTDSRYWGFVPRAAIVGKPFLIYFSLGPRGSEAEGTMAQGTTQQTRRSIYLLDTVISFARWSRTMRVVH